MSENKKERIQDNKKNFESVLSILKNKKWKEPVERGSFFDITCWKLTFGKSNSSFSQWEGEKLFKPPRFCELSIDKGVEGFLMFETDGEKPREFWAVKERGDGFVETEGNEGEGNGEREGEQWRDCAVWLFSEERTFSVNILNDWVTWFLTFLCSVITSIANFSTPISDKKVSFPLSLFLSFSPSLFLPFSPLRNFLEHCLRNRLRRIKNRVYFHVTWTMMMSSNVSYFFFHEIKNGSIEQMKAYSLYFKYSFNHLPSVHNVLIFLSKQKHERWEQIPKEKGMSKFWIFLSKSNQQRWRVRTEKIFILAQLGAVNQILLQVLWSLQINFNLFFRWLFNILKKKLFKKTWNYSPLSTNWNILFRMKSIQYKNIKMKIEDEILSNLKIDNGIYNLLISRCIGNH